MTEYLLSPKCKFAVTTQGLHILKVASFEREIRSHVDNKSEAFKHSNIPNGQGGFTSM